MRRPQPGIRLSFMPTPHLPGPGGAGSLCGHIASHRRAKPEPRRTLRSEGAGRVGCARADAGGNIQGGSCRRARWGALGCSVLRRGGRGRGRGDPRAPSPSPPTSPHTNLVVEVLQSLLARGPPDLHLPARFNRWLPAGTPALAGVRRLRVRAQVGDVPLLSHHLPRAPAHRQRVEIDGLILRGPFHRAEHATEFLPGLGAARAQVFKEGRDLFVLCRLPRLLPLGHGAGTRGGSSPPVSPSVCGSLSLPLGEHKPRAAARMPRSAYRKVYRKEGGLASGDPPLWSLPLTPLSPLPAHAPRSRPASSGERQSWVWEGGRCGSGAGRLPVPGSRGGAGRGRGGGGGGARRAAGRARSERGGEGGAPEPCAPEVKRPDHRLTYAQGHTANRSRRLGKCGSGKLAEDPRPSLPPTGPGASLLSHCGGGPGARAHQGCGSHPLTRGVN